MSNLKINKALMKILIKIQSNKINSFLGIKTNMENPMLMNRISMSNSIKHRKYKAK